MAGRMCLDTQDMSGAIAAAESTGRALDGALETISALDTVAADLKQRLESTEAAHKRRRVELDREVALAETQRERANWEAIDALEREKAEAKARMQAEAEALEERRRADEAHAKLEALAQRGSATRDELARLETDVARMRSEHESSLGRANAALESANAARDKATRAPAALQKELRGARAELEALRAERGQWEESTRRMSRRVSELQRSAGEALAAASRRASQPPSTACADHERVIAALKREVARQAEQLAAHAQQVVARQSSGDVCELRAMLASAQEQGQRDADRIAVLERQLAASTGAVEQWARAAGNCRPAELARKMAGLQEEAASARRSADAVSKKLAETAAAAEALRERLGKAEEERDSDKKAAERDAARMRADLDVANKLCEFLRTQLTERRLPEGVPTSAAEQPAEQEMTDLQLENERLRLENDQMQEAMREMVSTRVMRLADNPRSARAQQQQAKSVETAVSAARDKAVADSEKRVQRLKELFGQATKRFRIAVSVLFGYEVQMSGEREYRLRSVYAEDERDVLTFRNTSASLDQPPVLELVADAVSKRLVSAEMLPLLAKQQTLPAFTSSLTMDLFDRVTVK
eukprot:m51a1_g6866 putative mitotic spindle assembly checkpoint protein mad1 (591) ;mRNA; f:157386-159624